MFSLNASQGTIPRPIPAMVNQYSWRLTILADEYCKKIVHSLGQPDWLLTDKNRCFELFYCIDESDFCNVESPKLLVDQS